LRLESSRSTADRVSDTNLSLIGSIDRLVEKFLQLREDLGISSIMLSEIGDLTSVVERLADV
jgi:hypothetical protein